MPLRPRFAVILVVIVSLSLLGVRTTRTAAQTAPATVTLPGHVLKALAGASKVTIQPNAAAPQQAITITVVLRRSDEAGFQAYLNDINDKSSAHYQQFLDQTALAARYGPSQSAYDAVSAFLTQSGLSIVSGSANRLTLTAKGTRAQIEQAFATTISNYSLNGQSFYANDVDPAVPAALAADFQAVLGLNNLGKPHKSVANAAALAASSGPPPTPTVLPQAYDFAGVTGATGQGQKIGLVEFSTYLTSDVQAWASWAGVPPARVNQLARVAVGGGVSAVDDGTVEVMLDVETVMAMAPGANYVVYDAPNDGSVGWPAIFNAMINDNVSVISNSWSLCDNQVAQADYTAVDSVLASATASGIAVFAATGDNGNGCAVANGSSTTVYTGVGYFPAGSPYITAVGGTSLLLDGSGNYVSESWWNNSGGQGGYWTSSWESRPQFQTGKVSGAQRQAPDVSADAGDGVYVFINGAILQSSTGHPALVIGTSEATPEWAAGMALIYEKLGHRLGALNAKLYALSGTNAFHSAAAISSDFQHVGLGSFDLGQLYTGLTAAPACGSASATVQLLQPNLGASLAGSTQTFCWTAATGVSSYFVYLGSTGVGSQDLFSSGVVSSSMTQVTATNLPTNGRKLYLRLWSSTTGVWSYTDYAFFACTGLCGAAPPGAHFTGSILINGQNAPNGAVVAAFAGSTLCGTASGAGLYNGSAYLVDISGSIAPCNTPNTTLNFQVNGQAASTTGTVPSTVGATVSLNLSVTVVASRCPPAITSPVPGSTLAGSSVTFQWAPCNNATAYFLYVGTGGAGANNIYNSGMLSSSVTQQTVSNLPSGGSINVRLWYLVGSYQFIDYTYTGGSGGTFTLSVSSSGCGTTNPSGASSVAAGSSVSISATPCDGSHAFSGWSMQGASCMGGAAASPCTFAMPSGAVTVQAAFSLISAPQLTVSASGCGTTSPTGTSTPAVSSAISIGATPCDGSHGFSGWTITGASCAGGLSSSPCAFTMPNSSVTVTATFVASAGGCSGGNGTAAIVQPAPGSTLSGSAQTFCWTAGSGVTGYWLYAGTSGAGSYNLFNSGQLPGGTTSAAVTGLPTSGAIFVRLWYLLGSWQFTDYTYTGGSGGGSPQLTVSATGCGSTSPAGTSTPSVSSAISIGAIPCDGSHSFGGWTISGATCSAGTATSPCAFMMPNGTVSVTATFVVAGGGGGCSAGSGNGTAAIVQPLPGSTLSGSATTFCWSSGAGVTGYWLFVGSGGAGTYNVFNSAQLPASTTQQAVTGIPTSGTIFVRLWYQVGGAWQFSDFTFTG